MSGIKSEKIKLRGTPGSQFKFVNYSDEFEKFIKKLSDADELLFNLGDLLNKKVMDLAGIIDPKNNSSEFDYYRVLFFSVDRTLGESLEESMDNLHMEIAKCSSLYSPIGTFKDCLCVEISTDFNSREDVKLVSYIAYNLYDYDAIKNNIRHKVSE